MNKIDFILLFDALDANPNGDPDAGNMPRMDSETGHGLVTDVCMKRKIRNFVALTQGDNEGYEIYVKEKAILNNQHERAYKALNLDVKKSDAGQAKAWMCKNFFDIRTFGAVMTTGVNCGQVRGPVQLSFARSIDSVLPSEFAITRCAVTTEKEAAKQEGDNRTMGRKYTIPYALYCGKGCINPYLAEQTGFDEKDLDVLIAALKNMFAFDASAARPAGSMVMRQIILFKHDSKLGDAPAHKLYEMLTVSKKDGVEAPRSIADYDISIDVNAAPAGISIEIIE